ncbi:MAG: hypothetical protein COA67_08560 [Lutibacter sp.]|nr:MAG: hypothetical protein COA67_08560 [Lutibacter sp.]
MRYKPEILLTDFELKKVQVSFENNQYFRDPNLLTIGQNFTDIVKVSPIKGLIFIHGNNDTGFEHIRIRHEHWVSNPNWITTSHKFGEKKRSLQNQSLFRKDSIPFYDYCLIVDSIFDKKNLNLEKNKRSDKFDLFIGNHTHKDGKVETYHLLTYKNTKVVHTLFPKSNKYNPKRTKGFNLVRTNLSSSLNLTNLIQEIRIPYVNHKRITRYIFIIRRIPELKCEKSYIQINDFEGNPFKTKMIGLFPNKKIEILSQKELLYFENSDFRPIERKILEIEKLN